MSAADDAIARPFGPDDLEPLLERNGVDAVVLVQGACLDSDTDSLCARRTIDPGSPPSPRGFQLDDPRARAREARRAPRSSEGAGRPAPDPGETDPHWVMREPVLESLALLEQEGSCWSSRSSIRTTSTTSCELAERFPRPRPRRRSSRQAAAGNGRPPRLGGQAARVRRGTERLREALGSEHDAGRAQLDGRRLRSCGRRRRSTPSARSGSCAAATGPSRCSTATTIGSGTHSAGSSRGRARHEDALLGGTASRVYRLSEGGGRG